MTAKMDLVFWFPLLAAAAACFMAAPTAAFTHIVGGGFGWRTPDNLTFYEDWAKPRTFGVGDKLLFPYRTGVHSVVQVNETEFENCTQNRPIDMHYSGPTTIELPTVGTYYFYCGVGTHCEAGQRLKITVVDAEGSSGATPLPSPDHESSSASAAAPVEFYDAGMVSGMLILLFWALF